MGETEVVGSLKRVKVWIVPDDVIYDDPLLVEYEDVSDCYVQDDNLYIEKLEANTGDPLSVWIFPMRTVHQVKVEWL